ncbi:MULTISPECIES: sortase [Streptacidiphilus]|uniref:Sortase n=1 Tax=Streptacidiphilus cavernicola TaxID=3342716 RepID=A0ABV6UQQ7_9ACTN|nr:sortase [Streptacidiphilus jeojiense]
MTLTAPPPAAPQEPAPAGPAVAPRKPPRPRRPGRPDAAGAYGTALLILAALVFGLLLDIGPIGDVRHARDRETSYAALRKDLAEGTIPVGQTDSSGTLVRQGRPVALLTIPQLGLKEVVLEGTTSGVLATGVGHRRDTPLPGQAGTSVLMGRQSGFGGPFGHLSELRPSETFTVLTGQGTQTFRVLDVRRAGDPVPPALADGAARLVLVTADGPAFTPDGLLLVDADLVGKVLPAPARPLGSDGLAAAEKPMGIDPSAWVPLVLWAEALLLAAVGVTLARLRWGRWQAWICGVPVLGALGLSVADQVVRLLPNLI